MGQSGFSVNPPVARVQLRACTRKRARICLYTEIAANRDSGGVKLSERVQLDQLGLPSIELFLPFRATGVPVCAVQSRHPPLCGCFRENAPKCTLKAD